MADIKVEAIEPDPSATSLSSEENVITGKLNDESAPLDSVDAVAGTDTAPSMEEVKAATEEANIEDGTGSTNKEDATVKTEGHTIAATNGKAAEGVERAIEPELQETEKDRSLTKPSNSDKRQGDRGRSYNNDRKHTHKQGHYKKICAENVKSDLTSQVESSDPVQIRKQVEFYFSDSNLHMDKFLFSKVDGHKNNPVPISLIHSFKRMRHFQPYSAIVAALKDSKILDVVENDECIQRKAPLADDIQDKPIYEVQQVYENKAMARSVYVKGFGNEQPSTQFDIEAFFASYGAVNQVRLRRTNFKEFKGSVFVEFDSEDTAKAFLAIDPKPKWNGEDLMIKSKKQYCDEKVEDIATGKIRPNTNQNHEKSGYKGRRGDDKRDWRDRRKEDQKNGFQDRGHKGFGSSGRGRGRGRGRDDRDGRGGRNRNAEVDRQRKEHEVPKIAVAAEEPADETKATEAENSKGSDHAKDAEFDTKADLGIERSGPAVGPPSKEAIETAKKRAREEDDALEGSGSMKKIDNKDVLKTITEAVESTKQAVETIKEVMEPTKKRARDADDNVDEGVADQRDTKKVDIKGEP